MSVAADAPRQKFQTRDIAYVAVFAALISALAQVSLSVGAGLVPFTLQTLGVSLAALCLGPVRAFLAVALYLVMGAAGLPVFAGGKGGVGLFLGATGGYLLSFLGAALLSGWFARWIVKRYLSVITPFLFFGALVITRFVVIMPLGVGGMVRATGMSWRDGFLTDLAFIPGDLIKSGLAAFLAYTVHRAYRGLLIQR